MRQDCDQTVARRYRRLVENGAITVRAVTTASGGVSQRWFVCLRCAPHESRGTQGPGLDRLDNVIIAVLADDGRASAARIGAAVGASKSSVRRRIDRMLTRSLIHFDVVIDERILDYQELPCLAPGSPQPARQHWPRDRHTRHGRGGHSDVRQLRPLLTAASTDQDDLYDYPTGALAQTIGSGPFRTSPVLELVKRG